TYNYPQNRVSDYRINPTLYRLEYIMNDGIFDEIIDPLIADYQTKLMEMSDI
ncbi:peptide chain release factor 1, partial [Aliarcobacter skirrowii CCUG 10374]